MYDIQKRDQEQFHPSHHPSNAHCNLEIIIEPVLNSSQKYRTVSTSLQTVAQSVVTYSHKSQQNNSWQLKSHGQQF